MTIAIRNTVWDITSLCRWARGALPGHWCVYHIGHLARDRAQNPDLNNMAETILLLCETGHLTASAHRFRLPLAEGWTYIATRTEKAHMPRALIREEISAIQFRALQAVRERDPATSATRAIRNAISAAAGNSDRIATTVLDSLKDAGFVAPAEGKGWELTQEGRSALM